MNTRPSGSQFWYFRSFLGFCCFSARKTKKLEGGRKGVTERESEGRTDGGTEFDGGREEGQNADRDGGGEVGGAGRRKSALCGNGTRDA